MINQIEFLRNRISFVQVQSDDRGCVRRWWTGRYGRVLRDQLSSENQYRHLIHEFETTAKVFEI